MKILIAAAVALNIYRERVRGASYVDAYLSASVPPYYGD